jgi:hypothetical protein
MRKPTSFHRVALGAGAVPVVLMALGAVRNGLTPLLADPALIPLNLGYMFLPQALVLLVAALAPNTRRPFAVAALIALSVLLTAFQCWVWWGVPARESGLAWVLYLPLSLAAVLLVALACVVSAKHHNGS